MWLVIADDVGAMAQVAALDSLDRQRQLADQSVRPRAT